MPTLNLQGLSILGYSRVKPSGTATPAINPATGATLAPGYFWTTQADVDRAASLAAQAFAVYQRWPAKRRAAFLRRIADLFEANSATIIERANLETALPPGRLQGETARTCGQLRLFASLIEDGWWVDARLDHGDPNRKPLPGPDVRSMLMPLGPVAVFSSSNFPFAFSVAGGDTASALAGLSAAPTDVALVDLALGDDNGLDLISKDNAKFFYTDKWLARRGSKAFEPWK